MAVRKTIYFSEPELIEEVESQKNFSEYVKGLIREKIAARADNQHDRLLSEEIVEYIESRMKKWNFSVEEDNGSHAVELADNDFF